jgi:hypothetical protein
MPGDVNGTIDAAAHNRGETQGSALVSFTTNRDTAEYYATLGGHRPGLVLSTTQEELSHQGYEFFSSPEQHMESEVLVRGPVSGLNVESVP